MARNCHSVSLSFFESSPSKHFMANFEQAGSPAGTPGMAPVPSGKRRFPLLAVIIVLVLILVGVIVWRQLSGNGAGKNPAAAMRGAGGPVPVILGTVAQKDVPVYLDGLGTVQAFNSVTVRSRVDGQLQKLGFEEGQDIRAGDLVAMIDPAPFKTVLTQAQAKRTQDESQLRMAEIELHRNEVLFTNRIVSQDVIDTNRAQINQISALVKSDEAAIESAQVQLNYTTIKSPIDGRTGLRQVDVGNIIRSGDTNGLVVVTQLKPISITFTLPEQNLGEIQAHSGGDKLKVLAVDRDNKTVLDEGTLTVIDNQIDPTTGTIRLKATFPNANLRLWPGQFANTRLVLTVRTNAIVVPASVVQRGPEGSYAFVVEDDMSVQMRPVKVAYIEQQDAVIDSGLQPGEKIVVDGQYKLQPGSKIRPAETQGTNAPPGRVNSQNSTNRAGGKRQVGEGGGDWKKKQQSQ
ncbi:MAG: transporter [Verrucomicrobiales bacterium]|nr:transporter [Verrucomicrobiales bacterium]